MENNALQIEHLCVSFFTSRGEVRAVDDVSLKVPKGQIVGIVGESGCGKSMTARAVMDLIRKPGQIKGGRILLNGQLISDLGKKERRRLCGNEVSMIFQEPMTSLNPLMRVGHQVEEALLIHEKTDRASARKKTLEIFEKVGISDPEKRFRCYPHELSGGLRQRVMIAMAMICSPVLLIADEPTTALDTTVQAQILVLMEELCRAGTSILLISHNLGVISRMCDYVYVMYAGKIVEEAPVETLFLAPAHPYTRGLIRAVRSLQMDEGELETIPGVVPNLLHLPKGCSFSYRCGECLEKCALEQPSMTPISEGHSASCFLAGKGEGA